MDPVTGGCRCGAVRYTVDAAQATAAYACHCLDCQTWSGSAFSEQFIAPEAALSVTGPVETFELTSPAGRVSRQRVCGTCHTRVYNSNSARPGLVVVRAGTRDDSDHLTLAAHIWTKRKQPWLTLPEGTPSWPEGAPPADFMAALTKGVQG